MITTPALVLAVRPSSHLKTLKQLRHLSIGIYHVILKGTRRAACQTASRTANAGSVANHDHSNPRRIWIRVRGRRRRRTCRSVTSSTTNVRSTGTTARGTSNACSNNTDFSSTTGKDLGKDTQDQGTRHLERRSNKTRFVSFAIHRLRHRIPGPVHTTRDQDFMGSIILERRSL